MRWGEVTMKNKKNLIILFLVILLGTTFTYYGLRSRLSKESIIRVSGNIEVTDAEVSFKIPGRVEARLVDEGEIVKAGQLVARLDSVELAQEVALRRAEAQTAQAALDELEAGYRKEDIAQAEAATRQAQARLGELLAGSRPQEIAAAQATVERAKAETVRARADAERYEGLYKKQIVSAQQWDAARTAYETAMARQREAEEQFKLVKEGPRKEQIEQAREVMTQAREHFNLLRNGPRKEDIAQARARLEQAKAALAEAETRLGYAKLTSPLTGVVLSKNVEPGEYVSAGTPVVTVADLDNPWVRAYINETDLGRVKVGQRARVTTDTYPQKGYEGHVSFVASQAEFTPKSVQTQKERVKLVYRVKVEIRNPNMELKPGMPADVEILTGPGGK
jgi:HlyD family secretion protein